MYTNIPKFIGTPYSMASDIAAENFEANYYEKKYFGSNTGEGLDKDTYVKTDPKTGLPKKGRNITFKDKIKNFWNGTGGTVAKWLGLTAAALILLKKGKGDGKISKFFSKFSKKAGKETAKAGEEAAKKSGIMTKLSKLGRTLKEKLSNKASDKAAKAGEEATKKSGIKSKLAEHGKSLKSKLSNFIHRNKGKVAETAETAETTIKALPAAPELLKLPGA